MLQHVCNRCGWVFSRKSNLTQHLTSRKKSCRPTNSAVVGDGSLIDPKRILNDEVDHPSVSQVELLHPNNLIFYSICSSHKLLFYFIYKLLSWIQLN